MNNLKWYKLNKSNESMIAFLEDKFTELEEIITNKTGDFLWRFSGALISAIVSFYVGQVMTSLNSENNKFDLCFACKIVLSCIAIFAITFTMVQVLKKIIIKITALKNNKKNTKDIYDLEKVFYQKVFNDMLTAFSLEKKAKQIISEIENIDDATQEKKMIKMYILEAVFYFNDAIYSIEKNKMFEIYNCERYEYTEFLKHIDVDNISYILNSSIESLNRMKTMLKMMLKNDENIDDILDDNLERKIDKTKDMLKEYLHNITEQGKCII